MCSCAELDVVCPVCLARFARQLGDVPALLAELEVTRYEPRRGGSLAGGRAIGHARPLPFNAEAAELAGEIRREVVGCAREVMRDLHMPEHWAEWTLYASVGFLLGHLGWFAADGGERARQAISWLGERTAAARRMILGPSGRWYAGVCGAPLTELSVGVGFGLVGDVLVPAVDVERARGGWCDQPLFASTAAICDIEAPGRTAASEAVVVCRACKAKHPLVERRSRVIESARESLLPIDVILSALPWLIGSKVNAATARSWRRERKYRPAVRARKRAGVEGVSGRQLRQPAQLYPVGVDIDGRELFRVGEVIDLAEAAAARAAVRSQQREWGS